MNICIFSIYYAPESTATGYYAGELASFLARSGHEVTVFATYPYYPEWKIRKGYPAWRWSVETIEGVKVIRCPSYVPSKPNGLNRLIHYGSFAASSLLALAPVALSRKFDLVLNIAPSLFSSFPALCLAKWKRAVSWLHVQDFEVEAAFATGQLSASGKIAKLALWFERKMIGSFDQTSTISPEMCEKMLSKNPADANVIELRNWAEIDSIHPQPDSSFRKKWNISTKHVAMYSGSIAKKQGISIIVEVAKLLRSRTDITFIICGNGPEKAELEKLAESVDHVRVYQLQPREELNELLNLATVHLLPQKADAADLVLPSKLANMLASGRPVVAGAHPGTGLAREIDGCGIRCEPEDPQSMAAAIEQLLDAPEQHQRYSLAARKRALSQWHRQALLEMFDGSFTKVVHAKTGMTHNEDEQIISS